MKRLAAFVAAAVGVCPTRTALAISTPHQHCGRLFSSLHNAATLASQPAIDQNHRRVSVRVVVEHGDGDDDETNQLASAD